MAIIFNPHDPEDPGPGPYPRPPTRKAPPPRPEQDPSPPTSDLVVTAPETNRALPIVHGTAKIAGTIVEQYSSSVLAGPLRAPAWQTSFPYSVGDRVTANGNTYVATVAGISAASGTGPSGTGTGIVDGITSTSPGGQDIAVRWDFVQVGTDLFWKQNTAYTVNLMTTRVLANGNYYVCITSGTSAVSGTGPSGTALDITDGTCHWMYTPPGWRTQFAAAFCEGQIFGALAGFSDASTNLKDYRFIANEGIQLYNGTPTGIGARPAWFPTPDSVQRDDYSNVAVLLISSLNNGDRKSSNIALEIQSGTGVDATHPDENPADIAIDLLTHVRRGAGWAAARVDTTGTLGVGATSYRTYCTANGLLLSWVIDTATNAIELLGLLLAATNADPVWSNGGSLGGMLKIVPRGDQALTANGVTYTPVTTPVFNLTQDDTIGPVEITHRGSSNAFNSIPIEYTDRAAGYVRNQVDDPDMADVDKRGLQRGATVALPQVIAPAVAVMLSRIYEQRSLKVRNTYRFRLSHRFMLLEPTDIVTLADSVMGMPARPVRITAMEEEQTDGTFLFEAEDYPVAVHAAALYTPQTGDGFKPTRPASAGVNTPLPQAVAATTIVDSSSTRGGAVHNMWPNGTSEASPPDGANKTTAEWASIVNAGAGAYAGNFVREVTSIKGGPPTQTGDTAPALAVSSAALGNTDSALVFRVRAAPGDTFSFEAQVRGTVGSGTINQNRAGVGINYLDSNDLSLGGSHDFHVLDPVPSAYFFVSTKSSAPANTTSAIFCAFADASLLASGSVTAQFDAIGVYKSTDSSSDAASAAPSLTLAAGGNTFTDIPSTSQSFTPVTASRKVKVTLVFSGSGTGAAGGLDVRIVFGGTPTQAGVSYRIAYNTIGAHQGWPLMWALPATTLGPVGTAVTVKAQIRSPTGSAVGFTMDGNDSVSMIIEEIG